MKKCIIFIFIILMQTSFAQEKVDMNLIDSSFLSTLNKTNNNAPSFIESELSDFLDKQVTLTAEGKFLLNKESERFFGNILKISENPVVALDRENQNLETDTKKVFVNKIILQKLEKDITRLLEENESLAYGDRYIILLKNLESLQNKLIVTKQLTEGLEIQVGKSLYPYLNKINKTEIDKTLQNSLNLIAINF